LPYGAELIVRSFLSSIASAGVAGVLAVAFNAPMRAWAIPVFANGQNGVSCEQCHNAPPNLNAYGRFVMATNFVKGLDAHTQMRENEKLPVAVQLAENDSNTPDPSLPKVYTGVAGLLSGGYLGQSVTYYASVPVVLGGYPAAAVDQVWAAYDGLSGGSGSLQVGKFPTPVLAPWLSNSLSLTGYALAALPVGLNSVGVGDNRWGASYSQTGSRGLVGTVAYLTSTGAAENAYNGNVNYGGEGRSGVASLQYLDPSSHFTGGLAALTGTYPLPSGASDGFSRVMALIAYSTSAKYSVNVMALVGHDNNPNDGTGPAASNGISYEGVYNPYPWLHANLRYERTNDGLGTQQNNYVTALAINPIANVILTVENVSAVDARPVINYQVLYAGPWVRHPNRTLVAADTSAAPATPATSSATVAVAMPGKPLYATNCAACHGAAGAGGVGPTLAGIATKKTLEETVAFIEKPAGAIMPKLYPGTLSETQVRQVAEYIRATFH
jgi:mono/diheme cytochrome c family protein